jgi:hypothetical protein
LTDPSNRDKEHSTMTECGEILWTNGLADTACTVERGTEHSHSDYTPTDAIAAGIARPLPDGVYLARVELIHGRPETVTVEPGRPAHQSVPPVVLFGDGCESDTIADILAPLAGMRAGDGWCIDLTTSDGTRTAIVVDLDPEGITWTPFPVEIGAGDDRPAEHLTPWVDVRAIIIN